MATDDAEQVLRQLCRHLEGQILYQIRRPLIFDYIFQELNVAAILRYLHQLFAELFYA